MKEPEDDFLQESRLTSSKKTKTSFRNGMKDKAEKEAESCFCTTENPEKIRRLEQK